MEKKVEGVPPKTAGADAPTERSDTAELSRLRTALEIMRRKTHCVGGAYPECPYCKTKQTDRDARDFARDLDFSRGDDESEEEVDCEDCGRPFILKITFDVTWESTMTDEEFEVEEAKRPDPNQLNLLENV